MAQRNRVVIQKRALYREISGNPQSWAGAVALKRWLGKDPPGQLVKCHSVNKSLFCLLFVVGRCAARKEGRVGVTPASRATKSSTGSAKASVTPRPRPTPEDVHLARSRDTRFEATGVLLRSPNLHGWVEVRESRTRRVVAAWKSRFGVTGLSFSPDSALLAVDERGHLTVWKWRAKQVLHSRDFDTGGGQYRVQIAFSPDGKQLAVASGELRVFDLATWRTRMFGQLRAPSFVDAATWSPDGRYLALSQHDMVAFSVVEVRSGRVRPLGAIDAASLPIFSKDSHFLAGATNEGTFIWKTRSGAKVFLGGNYENLLMPLSFSPGARFLLVERGQSRYEVRRVSTGKRVRVFKQNARRVVWRDSKTLLLGDEARPLKLN